MISGNASNGIVVWNSDGNIIIGNYIGTDVTGNASGAGIGNGADGIYIGGHLGRQHHRSEPGAGNVLSGNANDGFENDATGSGNTVQAQHDRPRGRRVDRRWPTAATASCSTTGPTTP